MDEQASVACDLPALVLKYLHVAVSVTIRHVPDDVRDELAARAARAGKSLQEYLRSMLVESVARPQLADVLTRARLRVQTTGSRVDAAAILRALDAERR